MDQCDSAEERAPRKATMNGIIAEFDEVSKLYGTFAALRKVSVQFERGRCYLVLGPNGAGKSTLLRTLAGPAAAELREG